MATVNTVHVHGNDVCVVPDADCLSIHGICAEVGAGTAGLAAAILDSVPAHTKIEKRRFPLGRSVAILMPTEAAHGASLLKLNGKARPCHI